MKALIRNKQETVLPTSGIKGIDWNTGAPLTNPEWCGGPYTLVQNYVPPREDTPKQYEVNEPEPEIGDENDYVIIDGKRYSKKELRSLIE